MVLSVQVTGIKDKQKETSMAIHHKISSHNLNLNPNRGSGTGNGGSAGKGGSAGNGAYGGTVISSGNGIGSGTGTGTGTGSYGIDANNITNPHLHLDPHTSSSIPLAGPPVMLVSAPLVDLKRMVKRGPVFAGKAKLTFKDCMLAE